MILSFVMTETKTNTEALTSARFFRRLSRLSAWLLLAAVVVLVVTGWGITHTGIIYNLTFGLIDRRLADSIHRATNLPLAFFFLCHVLTNIDLALRKRASRNPWLLHLILIITGLALMGIVVYIEYWSAY
jgi:cytochrome b subunit of formate dehydrogenase